jgi:hypothetical protein
MQRCQRIELGTIPKRIHSGFCGRGMGVMCPSIHAIAIGNQEQSSF